MLTVTDNKKDKADDPGHIGFDAGWDNKRLARMLAGKLGVDLTTFMNELLQEALDAEWDREKQRDLLAERPPKKPRRRRPGDSDEQDKAA